MPRRRRRTPSDPLDGQAAEPLFTVPPAGFTRARNALAAELKAAGRTDEAAAVRALEKPTAAVWAINQLARRDPAAIERVVRAVDRLETGKPGESRPQLLAPAVERAKALMQDAGVSASDEMLERLATTLFAAAVDPETRAQLVAGRIRTELALPGFEVVGSHLPKSSAAPDRHRRESREMERRRERVARARAALEAARREAKQLEAQAATLERKAGEAQRAARDAGDLATRARERADRAAGQVRAAEAALEATERDRRSDATGPALGAPRHARDGMRPTR